MPPDEPTTERTVEPDATNADVDANTTRTGRVRASLVAIGRIVPPASLAVPAFLVGVALGPTVVAAQGLGAMIEAFCSSPLPELIGAGFGAIFVGLVLFSAARGGWAFFDRGSHDRDKKKRGNERLRGAGETFGGAIAFAGFILPVAALYLPVCLGVGGDLISEVTNASGGSGYISAVTGVRLLIAMLPAVAVPGFDPDERPSEVPETQSESGG